MNRWLDRLALEAPLAPAAAAAVVADAATQCAQLLASPALEPDTVADLALDDWFASPEAAVTLGSVLDAVWAFASVHSERAMPAHDFRHALVRVPASALRLLGAEPCTWECAAGLLGAFCHDLGRWIEERVFGHPQWGSVHATMSVALLAETGLLDTLPERFRLNVLQAVGEHSNGSVDTSPLPLRITTIADRDQLHGPEIILRLMHHMSVPPMGGMFQDGDGISVINRIARFACNSLPAQFPWDAKRQAAMTAIPAAFVWLASTPEEAEKRLATLPVAAMSRMKLLVADELAVSAWEERVRDDELEAAAVRLLACAGTAGGQEHIDRMLAGLAAVPPGYRVPLTRALRYAIRARDAETAQARADLARLERHEHPFFARAAFVVGRALYRCPPAPG